MSDKNEEIRGLTEKKLRVWANRFAVDLFTDRGSHTRLESFVKARIAELNHPAIHPEVVVKYHPYDDSLPLYTRAMDLTIGIPIEDIMLPAKTVMGWLKERRERGESSGYGVTVEEEISSKIAGHKINGPEENR